MRDLRELAGWVIGQLVRNGECLDWPHACCTNGYGVTGWRGRQRMTHRLVCELVHGPAPAGKPNVLHSCDRPKCCNPEHLRWGSQAENMQEKICRGWSRPVYEEKFGVVRVTRETKDLVTAAGKRLAAVWGVPRVPVWRVMQAYLDAQTDEEIMAKLRPGCVMRVDRSS